MAGGREQELPRLAPRTARRLAASIALLALAGAALWWQAWRDNSGVDRNRIAVFPLHDSDEEASSHKIGRGRVHLHRSRPRGHRAAAMGGGTRLAGGPDHGECVGSPAVESSSQCRLLHRRLDPATRRLVAQWCFDFST